VGKIDINYFDNNCYIDNYNYNNYDLDMVHYSHSYFDIFVDYYDKLDYLFVVCYCYYNFDYYLYFDVFIDYSYLQTQHLEMNFSHSFIFLLLTFVIHYVSYFVNGIYYLL
jgi:hypothetical protein